MKLKIDKILMIALVLLLALSSGVPSHATVNNSANKVVAAGNGVLTAFNFSFIAVAPSDLQVILTNSSGVETVLAPTAYSVSLTPLPPGQIWNIGGTVTYPLVGSPIPNGSTLTIVRELSLTQLVALNNQGSLFPTAVETGLDLLEMQMQQVSELFGRAIVAPVVDPSSIILTLPPAAQRANTGLAFDSQGNVIAGTTPATGLISTAMQPVVDAATLALGRAAFGLSTIAAGTGITLTGTEPTVIASTYTAPWTNAVTESVSAVFQNNIYAKDFGVVANDATDDTAAWNKAVAYANANPGTTIVAPQGISVISALTPFTAPNSFIACASGIGACTISASSTKALTWNGSNAKGGGISGMTIDNSAGGCTVSIYITNGAFNLQFMDVQIGSGVGTLAQLGDAGTAESGPGSAGSSTWTNLTGSPANVANCPVFQPFNGAGLFIYNPFVFISATTATQRNFVQAVITGPGGTASLWDTIAIKGGFIEFFYNTFEFFGITNGALLNLDLQDTYLANCVNACISATSASGIISTWRIQNNWIDGGGGTGSCIDIESVPLVLVLKIEGNRIGECFASGIFLANLSEPVDFNIANNDIFDINTGNTGTTFGIAVTSTGLIKNISIHDNFISSDLSAIFSPYHFPTNGVQIAAPSSDGVRLQNNRSTGTATNYILPTPNTMLNSIISGNIGLASTSSNPGVGASPLTYTAGARPESDYITGGTVSSVTQNGLAICAASPCTVNLAPNESIVITYSGTPTIASVLH